MKVPNWKITVDLAERHVNDNASVDILKNDIKKLIDIINASKIDYKIMGKNEHGVIVMNINPDKDYDDVCIICKYIEGCSGIPCYSVYYYLPQEEEKKLDMSTIPEY